MWGERRWGVRRLLSHINSLPPDSALVRSQLSAPMGWDNTTELQAATVDLLQVLSRNYLNAHSDSPSTDALVPVKRPYAVAVEPVRPAAISLSQLNAMLED